MLVSFTEIEDVGSCPKYISNTHMYVILLRRDPPFEPKPALQPIVEYLVKEIVRKYPSEICPVCNKPVLPSDPKVSTQ